MRADRRAILVALAALALLAWGWVDVRGRASLAPGVESRWRERLEKVDVPSVARHRTDVTVYLGAALALDRGGDPYAAQSPRGWRYVYPPLYATVLRPIARLPVADAAFLLHVANVAALLLAASWLARAIGPRGGVAVVAALLVASPFLVQTCQRGQVTILLLAIEVGALALLLRGRDVLAGVVLALGVALRLTPALLAAMAGMACVRRLVLGEGSWRGRLRDAVRFPAGVVVGLALGFAVVPAAVLGPTRAVEVTRRWAESTREIYSVDPKESPDLAEAYGIDELSFKNQGVRRVALAWLGVRDRGRGADADRDEAVATSREAAAGLVAMLVGFAAAILSLVLGAARMGSRDARFRRTFAFGVLAPVFVSRYAWPVHYVAAIPLLAEAVAAVRVRALVLFAAGVVLFYAGHRAALRWFPEHGALLVATALACVSFLRRDRRAEAEAGPVLARYAERDPFRVAYLRARLERGGIGGIADLLPPSGTVVDLGCGDGLLATTLALRSARVVAVDHDPARVARLRAAAEGLPVEAVASPMESFPLPPCDGVALVDVAHYLDAPAQDALLRRVLDALRPGGVLVLRDPDAGAGLRFAWTRLHERVMTALGWTRARIGRYRTASEWVAALRAAGFAEATPLPLRPRSPYADRTVVARKASA